jgi:hypothetical protein
VRIASTVILLGVVFLVGFGVWGQTGNGTVYPHETGELFTDVPNDHWAYDDLKYLTDREILTGIVGGEFRGDQAMDRYTGAALVARAMRYLQSNPSAVTMDDLNAVRDFMIQLSDEVEQLRSSGIPAATDPELGRRVDANAREIGTLRSDVDALIADGGVQPVRRFTWFDGLSLLAVVLSIAALIVAFAS